MPVLSCLCCVQGLEAVLKEATTARTHTALALSSSRHHGDADDNRPATATGQGSGSVSVAGGAGAKETAARLHQVLELQQQLEVGYMLQRTVAPSCSTVHIDFRVACTVQIRDTTHVLFGCNRQEHHVVQGSVKFDKDVAACYLHCRPHVSRQLFVRQSYAMSWTG